MVEGDAPELPIGRGTFRLGMFKEREFEWGVERALTQMSIGGAELGECFVAAHGIREGDLDSWVSSWRTVGDKAEEFARQALDKGQRISARSALLRAATYYRTAEYLCPIESSECAELFFKGVDLCEEAAVLFDPPVRRIHVVYDGMRLPGYFWRPKEDDVKRPTIFMVGGNDSWVDEMAFKVGSDIISRGYNMFMFEHPGHRGAAHLYPGRATKRSFNEGAFKAVFDLLETLPGVDERICLNGYSHGGYVSTQVACREPRVAALVPSSPIHNLVEVNQQFLAVIPTMARTQGVSDDEMFVRLKRAKNPLSMFISYSFWTCGQTTFSGFWDWLMREPPVVTSELKNIRCPVLSICGEGEGELLIRQAREVHEAVPSNQKRYHEFSLDKDMSDDHCQIDNRSRAQQIMFEWLDPIFNVSR